MWCKSVSEFQLKSDIKNWFFGLTTIEKFRAKQQSHLNLMAIKAAEASLRLFFMQINDRRRKIFIWQLEADGRSCTVILRKWNACLTTSVLCSATLSMIQYSVLGFSWHSQAELGSIGGWVQRRGDAWSNSWPGVRQSTKLRLVHWGFPQILLASGKRGSNVCSKLLQSTWSAFLAPGLNSHSTEYWYPREAMQNVWGTTGQSARHIALQSYSKLLANRLPSCLNLLVSRVQDDLIKKVSIHGNYLYQNLVKDLHWSNTLRSSSSLILLRRLTAFDGITCWKCRSSWA